MAIYQGNQGGGMAGGGTNAVFDSISQASQRYAESRQAQRNEDFLSKLKGQGLLGVKAEQLIDSDTGKIKLGPASQGFITDVKGHYDKVSGAKGMKDLKRVFGRNATSDDVKNYITGVTKERDQQIGQAITRRLSEIGVDVENPGANDIWKVVDKGDEAFKSWYNSTDEATRKQLRGLGYHPDQEELAFLPDFLEKSVAQGKIDKDVARGLLGVGGVAGVTAAGAGARRFGKDRVEKSYKEAVKSSKELQALRDKRQSFTDNTNKYKKELEALDKELKTTKIKKRAKRAKIEARIAEVKKLKRKNTFQRRQYLVKQDKGSGRPLGRTQYEKDIREVKRPLKSKSKGSLSNIGKGGIGKNIGSFGLGLGGWELGRAVGEKVGGETGGLIGGLGGSYGLAKSLPLAMKALSRIMPAGTPHTALVKGALAIAGYGTGKLIDYAFDEK
tara:strand:+ start:397 stop:1728 length:1332 start_codon:yes stop_codon:yes gene_type:complete